MSEAEDRVVALMRKLEESVEAAKAARDRKVLSATPDEADGTTALPPSGRSGP